ncbi:hypothetical protein BDN72DRAFT_101415 [Pluteus cervinus]|uniref:Uncharacterized protein n=1 Tax=Pluteus cervinus TaxID=181527 RepID=A0ACD3B864_9AGAR|nr:hypothetical protein BDN72DRAFT_101415 [Pluteus cervinus]
MNGPSPGERKPARASTTLRSFPYIQFVGWMARTVPKGTIRRFKMLDGMRWVWMGHLTFTATLCQSACGVLEQCC